jgi:hypothetical protein
MSLETFDVPTEEVPFYDCTGREVKIGDILAIPGSGRGYGMDIGLVYKFDYYTKTGRLRKEPELYYRKCHKAVKEEGESWEDRIYDEYYTAIESASKTWPDKIKYDTCHYYCVIITETLTEAQKNYVKLAQIN